MHCILLTLVLSLSLPEITFTTSSQIAHAARLVYLQVMGVRGAEDSLGRHTYNIKLALW